MSGYACQYRDPFGPECGKLPARKHIYRIPDFDMLNCSFKRCTTEAWLCSEHETPDGGAPEQGP